ncbi:MAG: enoyl-CoA hydratase [Desulfobacterales bacterium]|nr:enoyl-CoA hydratase [Desulfobacterales bacterium]
MESPVLFDVDHKVAVVTLNRPERRNAINQALLTGLYDALEKIQGSEDIRAGVITGNGKSFCAGIDLTALGSENLFDPRGDGKDLMAHFTGCTKPLIGAVNGHAITGGFEIALNCDFLIASENASFADTHAKVGIHPGWGMTQLLQQAVGRRRACQMSYTCEFITAQRAYDWGLVNEVVSAALLVPRAVHLARCMAGVNPDILRQMKNLIEARDRTTMEAALTLERQGFNAFIDGQT